MGTGGGGAGGVVEDGTGGDGFAGAAASPDVAVASADGAAATGDGLGAVQPGMPACTTRNATKKSEQAMDATRANVRMKKVRTTLPGGYYPPPFQPARLTRCAAGGRLPICSAPTGRVATLTRSARRASDAVRVWPVSDPCPARFFRALAKARALLCTPPMQPSPRIQQAPAIGAETSEESSGFARRLFYRWFVEYNPLYLLSAALVLAGCFLWSRGLVGRESLAGPLGIAAVAELYAASLVGGAALLTRIGLRRPAVMLAFLFVLYQWDTTLHTETCAYLGLAGAWATALWLAVFVGKLAAIGWALRIRLARNVVLAALVAGAGLALGPRVVPGMGGRFAGAVVASWLFALGALYQRGGIASDVPLDDWGHTVLRRATRATWLLSGGLVGIHVAMWWKDHDISLAPLVLTTPLLVARRVQSEGKRWAILAGTLVVAAELAPGAFFVTSLLAAVVLALRAIAPAAPPPAEAAQSAQPYRANGGAVSVDPPPVVASATVCSNERDRAIAGALFAAYLAAWTVRWSNGAWPSHVLWLDALLTAIVVVALAARLSFAKAALFSLAASCGHLVCQEHLVPIPSSTLAWGECAVTLGFFLLGVSLLASYRLRAHGRLHGAVEGAGMSRPAG